MQQVRLGEATLLQNLVASGGGFTVKRQHW